MSFMTRVLWFIKVSISHSRKIELENQLLPRECIFYSVDEFFTFFLNLQIFTVKNISNGSRQISNPFFIFDSSFHFDINLQRYLIFLKKYIHNLLNYQSHNFNSTQMRQQVQSSEIIKQWQFNSVINGTAALVRYNILHNK